MRRIIRIFAWFLAALVVLAAGLLLYLRNADLSLYHDQIEAFLSDKIGHEVRIDGRFELHFGSTTTLIAEDISISNPGWSGDSRLVDAAHLEFAFRTWSLIRPPFLVEQLVASDIQGFVAQDEEGQVNWATGRPAQADAEAESFDLNRIAFRNVSIQDVELVYDTPAREGPAQLLVETLTVSPDDNGILDLDLRGSINELPLWADGKLGPWQNFVAAQDIFVDLDLTLGTVRLAIDGRVADVLAMEGVELNAVLGGNDIAAVLERLHLPPFTAGDFEVTANVQQREQGHQARIDGHLGEIALFASGSIDNLLIPHSVAYDFSISGPNARHVAELAGIHGASAEPFQVSGDYSRDGMSLRFRDTLLRVGENSLNFDVSVNIDAGNLDIELDAGGPDFSVFGPFAGISGLPSENFTVSGRLRKDGTIWEADNVKASVGQNRLTIHGQVESGSGNRAEIAVQASGPDISVIEDFTDVQGLPARAYDVDVVLRSHPDGVEILSGTGLFGDNRLQASGLISSRPGLDGTRVRVEASGPEFHNVALLAEVPYLPAGPFDVGGDVEMRATGLVLRSMTATVGDFAATASGRIGLSGEQAGDFELDVSLQGSGLEGLPGIAWPESLLGEAFRVAGPVARSGEEITLRDLEAGIGNLGATLNGSVTVPGGRIDLSVTANANDARMLTRLTGLKDLPDGAVNITGGIATSDDRLVLRNANLQVGGYQASADGRLYFRPEANNSDLRFSVAGPSLAGVGRMFGMTSLAEKEFGVSGRFDGTPSGFEIRDLDAKVGDNDLHGRFNIDLRGKPRIEGRLYSQHLDVTDRLARERAAEASQSKPARSDGRIFSDEPLETGWLQAADVEMEVRIDEFRANTIQATDIDIGILLRDGALRIEPFHLRERTGTVDANFTLAPENNVYSMAWQVEIDNVHLGLLPTGDDSAAVLPALSGGARFEGRGNSIRSIMASSNGEVSMRQGSGQVKELFGTAIFKDVLVEVFRTIMPTRRERGFQTLECGFYDATIKDGVVTLDRMAVQTDAMTVVASGSIRLQSEKLDITFRAKPRAGIGVSLGTVVNSFLAVSGTLADPAIIIDPARSATATGAAVATGGLSLLARGLWDRMSAEASICDESRK